MAYQEATKYSPAAVAAMLHYLSVDIQEESWEAAELIRKAALALEAVCRQPEREPRPAAMQLPVDVERLLHSVGPA